MSARLGLWVMAIRPRTLPASIVPVVVGSAVAAHRDGFVAWVAALALAVALLLQIATNLINDWGDHVRGADGPDRIGPARASQTGAVEPRAVAAAGLLALALASAAGLALVARGGWPAVCIGIASVCAAVAYTAGPMPLAYHGLGEVFVFAFFGPVAVLGTQYLQAGTVDALGVVASVSVGSLAAAILLVNNVRDVETDRRAHKRTVVVRFGREAGRRLYTGALVLGFGAPIVAWITGLAPIGALAGLLASPLAVAPLRAVRESTDGAALNHALAATARLELAFGLLLAVGIVA